MMPRGVRWAVITVMVGLMATPVWAQGVTMQISGDIDVPAGTVHEGFVMTMNGRIRVDGEVRGDVMTLNGDIAITGTVTGSVRSLNGTVRLASSARVGGDVYTGNGRIDRAPGAQVGGRISQGGTPAPYRLRGPWRVWGRLGWPGAWLWLLAASAVLGIIVLALLLAVLFPIHVGRVAMELATEPGLAFLVGVALWMVIPPLVVLLVLSLVGIVVVAFLPLALAALGVLGVAGVAMLLGERLGEAVRWERQPVPEALLGAVVLGLLVLIPGVGGVVFVLAATWGAGAVLLLALRRFRQAPRTAG